MAWRTGLSGFLDASFGLPQLARLRKFHELALSTPRSFSFPDSGRCVPRKQPHVKGRTGPNCGVPFCVYENEGHSVALNSYAGSRRNESFSRNRRHTGGTIQSENNYGFGALLVAMPVSGGTPGRSGNRRSAARLGPNPRACDPCRRHAGRSRCRVRAPAYALTQWCSARDQTTNTSSRGAAFALQVNEDQLESKWIEECL